MYNVEDALKERSQNLESEIKELEVDIKNNQQELKAKIDLNDQDPNLDTEEEIEKLKKIIDVQIQELKHDKFNYLSAKANKGDNKLKKKTKSIIKKRSEKVHTLPFNFTFTLQILVILDFVT
jgi:predicted GTPase